MRDQTRRETLGRKSAIGLAVSAALAGAGPASAADLEEVIVTATRRETTVLDVPYNISAITGEKLEQLEIRQLGELVRFVPGLSYNDVGLRQGGNSNTLIMRGLSAEPQSGASEAPNLARSTVSTYIGETPVYYNLRLTDLERVEVLRGPQGTLYGAGSLGGTLRFIPRRPETDGVSTFVNAAISTTADADDNSYDVDGMINMPLSESFALRVSAGHSSLAGFVDAVGIGLRDENGAFLLEDPSDFLGSGPDLSGSKDDSNDGEANHARAAALWAISDDVEALLTLHYQDAEADNYQGTTPGADRTLQLRGLNPFDSELQLGSLEVTADLGFATLTSATSYFEAKTNSRLDSSGVYEDFFAEFYFYYPRISTLSDFDSSDEAFVQEFRLTSNGDGRVDWVVGAFYLDQEMKFDVVQTMPGFEEWFEAAGLAAYFGTPSPLTTPPNLVYQQHRTTAFDEAALFGEVTFHITAAWDITAGGRFFRQEIDNDDTSILPTCFTILEGIGLGFYCGSPPLGGSSNRSNDTLDDQIFKVNTAYAFSERTRAYFTWSQGFRNGGVNALPTVGFIDDSVGGQFPDVNSFSADKVDNWEVGLKGTLGDGKTQYTIAVFNMEWKDPQARIIGAFSGIEGVGNSTADARSQGVELEISGILAERWDYALGYSYTDAEFVEDGTLYIDAVQDGDPLPGHSRDMASGSVTYTVPLSDDNRLQFNVSGFYRSSFENGLLGGLQEFQLDSYSLWDASIAYDTGNWVLRLFGRNLGDEDAVASASIFSPSSERLVVTRPRTIGLSFTYRYE